MKIIGLLKAAEEMEVPRKFAVNARLRYLTQRLEEIDQQSAALLTWFDGGVNEAFVAPDLCDLLIEKCRLLQELNYMKTIMDKKQDITDSMIEQARSYPIEMLIEFRHGKAKAFCHEDKNPSMYHASRTNRANCPVCDKSFDPIAVLIKRDNFSFVDAVKSLSGGYQ
jgi:hypothetical protein